MHSFSLRSLNLHVFTLLPYFSAALKRPSFGGLFGFKVTALPFDVLVRAAAFAWFPLPCWPFPPPPFALGLRGWLFGGGAHCLHAR